MSEYDPIGVEGANRRRAIRVGLVALIPPLAYVIGTWNHPGHGRPFMFSNLWGPGSSHSIVGLILLFVGMIFSPMLSAGLGIWLVRQTDAKKVGWFLYMVGVVLLVVNLLTRQP